MDGNAFFVDELQGVALARLATAGRPAVVARGSARRAGGGTAWAALYLCLVTALGNGSAGGR